MSFETDELTFDATKFSEGRLVADNQKNYHNHHFDFLVISYKSEMNKMRQAIIPLLVLLVAVGFDLTNAQGYGNLDDDEPKQPQQPSSSQITSLPQYESSQGTKDENYWWAKENPFQKPSNHPGVEKSDTRPVQTYSGQSKPFNPGQKSPEKNIKQSQKDVPKKDFKYRPIVTPYNNQNHNDFEENPCMLRVKSDCHGGSQPPSSFNVAQSPPSSQEQQSSYSGNQHLISQNEPDTPYSSNPFSPKKPSPTLNNQYSNSGSIGNSAQSYSPPQQHQQYNQPQPSYNQQSQQSGRPSYNQQSGRPYQGSSQNGQGFEANQNYEEQPPYPGCAAALLCVPDDWCNATGFSEGHPLSLTPAAKSFRVALMACTNVETNEVGVCCRDPDYKDPWPGAGGEGGHHHEHHENKPSNQQGQQPQPQFQQQQPQPQFQQQQPQSQFQQQQPQPQFQQQQPQPQFQPAQPQQSYSGSQSYQPPQVAPQQKPSYSSASQSYQGQQQNPSFSGQSIQQQPQIPPAYSGQPISQPQAQATYPGQSTGPQTYQKPQQTTYNSGVGPTYQQQAPKTNSGSGYSGVGCKSQSY